MFIVWGKKIVTRKVGYVADFCDFCREPQPFLLKRLGSAGHIYYISFSSGELVGFQRVCQKCKNPFTANPSDYTTTSKKPGELDALTALTYPNLAEVMKTRLELERRVRLNAASFSPEERKSLILERIMLFAGKVEARFSATHLDKEIGLAIIVAILLAAFGPEVAGRFLPDDAPLTTPYFGIVGIILVGWQIAVSGRRFMNRQVLPLLAQSLHPINPSDAELEQATAELTKRGLKIGKKLNLKDLKARLQSSAFLR